MHSLKLWLVSDLLGGSSFLEVYFFLRGCLSDALSDLGLNSPVFDPRMLNYSKAQSHIKHPTSFSVKGLEVYNMHIY